jgi:hypothetical protein
VLNAFIFAPAHLLIRKMETGFSEKDFVPTSTVYGMGLARSRNFAHKIGCPLAGGICIKKVRVNRENPSRIFSPGVG